VSHLLRRAFSHSKSRFKETPDVINKPIIIMNNYPAQNYYSKHIQKKDYDNAFREARQWAIESGETAITAARVYHVKEDACASQYTA
jgi:hypothetical protein